MLVALHRGRGFIAKAIQWQTRSVYSHASLLFEGSGEDKRVQEIAGAQVPQAVKVERLGELLFGEEWSVAPTGQREERKEEEGEE